VTSSDTAAAQSKAWKWLCSLPSVSVLWQRMQGGEQLAKSGLLQLLELQGRLMPCLSPPARTEGSGRAGGLAPLLPDLPDVFKNGVSIDWQTLAPKHISASGYADLRACPYRFYAKQILGLRDSPELDETVEKRDFGTWLHGTLHRFHESLKQDAAQESEALLDRCAAAEQKALGLDDAAFLPFALIWPQTRSAYLAWLVTHEAAGLTYQQGEQKRALALTVEEKKIELVGTIDRIDADSVGNTWLLDYKTESADKTGKRIKEADEDTQLAFYAVLVSGEQSQNQRQVNAAYVNLVERVNNKQGRRGTQTHALPELELRRDALLNGISSDLTKIAAGHGLRALGEGDACAYCTVRGLCRKDFQ
jgi:ATP-dependent helicase/nuclease subunit B